MFLTLQMAPNCKIINFTSESSNWVRELLLEGENEGEADNVWNISTKYYKARVIIDLVDYKEILEDVQGSNTIDFEATEAVVFHCDTSESCLGKFQRDYCVGGRWVRICSICSSYTRLMSSHVSGTFLKRILTECGGG